MTNFAVPLSQTVNVSILCGHWLWEDWGAGVQIACVHGIALRNISVDETGHRVPVCSHPHMSMLVHLLVNHLFIKPICGISCVFCQLYQLTLSFESSGYSLSLLLVELIHCCLFLVLLLFVVLFLLLSDLIGVCLLESSVIPDDTVHVLGIHLDHNDLLTLLIGLVTISEAKLLRQLLL